MNDGTIGRIIIDKIKRFRSFYSCRFSFYCSKYKPWKEEFLFNKSLHLKSYDIASFITNDNKSSILNYTNAGESFKGSIRDEYVI